MTGNMPASFTSYPKQCQKKTVCLVTLLFLFFFPTRPRTFQALIFHRIVRSRFSAKDEILYQVRKVIIKGITVSDVEDTATNSSVQGNYLLLSAIDEIDIGKRVQRRFGGMRDGA